MLPITPDETLKPQNVEAPALDIILLLLSTVGLPYVLISSTGPLLQSWFAKRFPDKSPYRLYALSNIGSLLGLLTYPFLIEPNLGLATQTLGWSGAYIIFILFCTVTAIIVKKHVFDKQAMPVAKAASGTNTIAKPSIRDIVLWIALSSCGSTLLLAGTNFICQDIAMIRFFWVIPLALYLITFIIAFDSPKWYRRWFWIGGYIVLLPFTLFLFDKHYQFDSAEIGKQLGVYLGILFFALMTCHGELARTKPAPEHLTFYFQMVSIGGALGRLFVTFLAPDAFSDFWE